MKTLKFALIAILVSCTMVSLASADNYKEKASVKKIVTISLTKAITNPGLVIAMKAQLDKESFFNYFQLVYTADVNFQGNIYRITGTRQQWLGFFTRLCDRSAKVYNSYDIN